MKNLFDEIDVLQKEINSHKPLKPELIKQVKEYYKIGLTYSSNAIEGNTLTETETKIILEEGITIGGKPLKDHFEAVGHAQAYERLYHLCKEKTIREDDIKQLHELFYFHIDRETAGKYRKQKVIITGSKYPLPSYEKLPSLMKNLIPQIETLRKERHPVEAAALIHKEFVFIHPFIDGNGRVARLLMNLFLMQKKFNIAIIPPILRREYIDCLEKAHQNDKDFITFIAQRVRETQKDYLRLFVS